MFRSPDGVWSRPSDNANTTHAHSHEAGLSMEVPRVRVRSHEAGLSVEVPRVRVRVG